MSGISCPLPNVVTYRDTRDMYNKMRKEFPDLPGVSGHRREAARRLGLDYKTFMDIFTKRIPDSSGAGVTRSTVARSTVAKSPKVKPPKSMYKEVVGENEFGQETTEMFWGRKKLGEFTKIERDYGNGITSTEYVGRIGTKRDVVWTNRDSAEEIRGLIASRGSFDMDIKKEVDALLERLAAQGELPDLSAIGKLDAGGTFNSTSLADAAARASMSMEHQKIVFQELDRQMQWGGKIAQDGFRGIHKYDGADEIAHYRMFEHSMTVNPTYGKMTVNRLDELHFGGEKNMFYSRTASTEYGGGMESVIAHEFGHHIDSMINNYIAVTKMPDLALTQTVAGAEAHIAQFLAWRIETEAARRIANALYAEMRAIIMRDMNLRSPTLYARGRALEDKPFGDWFKGMVQWDTPPRHASSRMFEGHDAVGGKTHFYVSVDWAQYVSYYGGNNHQEFFAEVWAEFTRDRAVRAHIREMGIEIQRTLMKLERLRKVVTS